MINLKNFTFPNILIMALFVQSCVLPFYPVGAIQSESSLIDISNNKIQLANNQPEETKKINAVESYFEDFQNTDFYNPTSSNVTGWGTGELNLPIVGAMEIEGTYYLAEDTFYMTDSGNFGFFIDSIYIVVMNITLPNPSDWSPINYYFPLGSPQEIVIVGRYAYVASLGSGLEIINISDPTNIFQVGSFLGYSSRGVAVNGNYAYLTDMGAGVHVLDISIPTNPTLVTTIPYPSAQAVVEGNMLYIADNGGLLRIFNVTNPSNPILLSSTPLALGPFTDLQIEGSLLYILYDNSLVVMDITTSTLPILLDEYYISLGTIPQNLAIDGDYAFLVVDNPGYLLMLNISDPYNIETLDAIYIALNAVGILLRGNAVFVTDKYNTLYKISYRDQISPNLIGQNLSANEAIDVKIVGNLAYVADYNNGVKIINITNPKTPITLGSYNTPGVTYKLDVEGSLVFVADGSSGMQILNASDPSNPVLVANYNTPDVSREVEIDGNLVYIADTTSGLQIVNVSNPSNPTFVGAYNTPGYAIGVTLKDNLAFISDSNYGVQIINIVDPSNPLFASSFVAPSIVYEVVIDGEFAYIHHESGLEILNIANPTAPITLSSLILNEVTYDLSKSGNYLYVAARSMGFIVINVTDPMYPIIMGSYSTVQNTYGIEMSGDYIYTASWTAGLRIYRVWVNRLEQHALYATAVSNSVFNVGFGNYITSATLLPDSEIPQNTIIEFYLSINGINWESVTPGISHGFMNSGSELYWRIAMISSDITLSPTLRSLELQFHYYSAPVQIAPVNQNILVNSQPTFIWNQVDESSQYHLQIDTSLLFNSSDLIDLSLNATSYLSINELVDGIWFWRVAVVDNGGQGPFSQPWSIGIYTQPPMTITEIETTTETTTLPGSTDTVTSIVEGSRSNQTITTTETQTNDVPQNLVFMIISTCILSLFYRKKIKQQS